MSQLVSCITCTKFKYSMYSGNSPVDLTRESVHLIYSLHQVMKHLRLQLSVLSLVSTSVRGGLWCGNLRLRCGNIRLFCVILKRAVYVCVCLCVGVGVGVCVWVCVYARVRVHACVCICCLPSAPTAAAVLLASRSFSGSDSCSDSSSVASCCASL